MERLTRKNWRNLDPWETCGQDNYCKRGCHEQGGCTKGCIVPRIYARLAAYEDTGLEPEDVISAVDMAKIACALHELNAYKDLGSINHLRDLIQAERDGRLVVLPCKVGDTVWVLFSNGLRPYVVDRLYVMANGKVMVRMRHMLTETLRISEDNFGKTVFLTRDEALAWKGISE